MKKTMKLMLCLFGLVSLSGAMFGGTESRLVVNVPFGFVAGSVRLPAGQYTVRESSENGIIFVTNTNGSAVALITSPGNRFGSRSSVGLSFDRVAGEPHLAQITFDDQPARMIRTK
jgi:hypothetical protein